MVWQQHTHTHRVSGRLQKLPGHFWHSIYSIQKFKLEFYINCLIALIVRYKVAFLSQKSIWRSQIWVVKSVFFYCTNPISSEGFCPTVWQLNLIFIFRALPTAAAVAAKDRNLSLPHWHSLSSLSLPITLFSHWSLSLPPFFQPSLSRSLSLRDSFYLSHCLPHFQCRLSLTRVALSLSHWHSISLSHRSVSLSLPLSLALFFSFVTFAVPLFQRLFHSFTFSPSLALFVCGPLFHAHSLSLSKVLDYHSYCIILCLLCTAQLGQWVHAADCVSVCLETFTNWTNFLISPPPPTLQYRKLICPVEFRIWKRYMTCKTGTLELCIPEVCS